LEVRPSWLRGQATGFDTEHYGMEPELTMGHVGHESVPVTH